jgi:hypothetical protein
MKAIEKIDVFSRSQNLTTMQFKYNFHFQQF